MHIKLEIVKMIYSDMFKIFKAKKMAIDDTRNIEVCIANKLPHEKVTKTIYRPPDTERNN